MTGRLPTAPRWVHSGTVGVRRTYAACTVLVVLGCREPNPDFVDPSGTDAGSADDDGPAPTTDDGASLDDASADDGAPACGVDEPPIGGNCPDVCEPGCPQDVCTIECDAQSCAGEMVECPAGFDCHVRCEDDGACEGATIVCPPEHACRVECDADAACADAIIACAAGTCELECQDGFGVCNDTQLWCGANDSWATCEESDVDAIPRDTSTCGCQGCD